MGCYQVNSLSIFWNLISVYWLIRSNLRAKIPAILLVCLESFSEFGCGLEKKRTAWPINLKVHNDLMQLLVNLTVGLKESKFWWLQQQIYLHKIGSSISPSLTLASISEASINKMDQTSSDFILSSCFFFPSGDSLFDSVHLNYISFAFVWWKAFDFLWNFKM